MKQLDEYRKNIANRLLQFRKKLNISQEELVQRIGEETISLRTYKTYEKGKGSYFPSLEKILYLCEFFNCSIDYFVSGENVIPEDSFKLIDNASRLFSLIYSHTLIPFQDNDKNSKYYGKYYFAYFDPEIDNFMKNLETQLHRNNLNFQYYGSKFDDSKTILFNSLQDIGDLKMDMSPSMKRLNVIKKEAHLEGLFEEIEKQNKQRREIGKLKKID